MSFSVGMSILSAWAFDVSLQLNRLEDGGVFGSNIFVVATLAGMCVFALLTLAHATCLVLRHTIWSDERD
jgi:hypothetical protein